MLRLGQNEEKGKQATNSYQNISRVTHSWIAFLRRFNVLEKARPILKYHISIRIGHDSLTLRLIEVRVEFFRICQ